MDAGALVQGIAQAVDTTWNIADTFIGRKWQEKMWDKANEYNSPKAQMERLADAGLNPNLVYNSTAPTGQAAASPNWMPHQSNFAGSVGSFLDAYYNNRIKQEQIKALQRSNRMGNATEFYETLARDAKAQKDMLRDQDDYTDEYFTRHLPQSLYWPDEPDIMPFTREKQQENVQNSVDAYVADFALKYAMANSGRERFELEQGLKKLLYRKETIKAENLEKFGFEQENNAPTLVNYLFTLLREAGYGPKEIAPKLQRLIDKIINKL